MARMRWLVVLAVGCGPVVPSQTDLQACDQVGDLYGQRATECSGDSYFGGTQVPIGRDDCLDLVRADGGVVTKPDVAGECLGEIQDAGCGMLSSGLPPHCHLPLHQ